MEIPEKGGGQRAGEEDKGTFLPHGSISGQSRPENLEEGSSRLCPEVWSLCSLCSVEPRGGVRAQGGAQAPTGLPHPGVGPLSFCRCEMGRKCLSDSLQRQVLRGVPCRKLAPGRCTNHHQAASLAIPRNGPGVGTGSNRSRVLPVNPPREVGGL